MENFDKFKALYTPNEINPEGYIHILKWLVEIQKYNTNNLIGMRDLINNLIKFSTNTNESYEETLKNAMDQKKSFNFKQYEDQNKYLLEKLNTSFQTYIKSNNDDLIKLFKNSMESMNVNQNVKTEEK